GEHRIFMEDRVRGLRIAQPLDEGSEAFLRRLSAQKLLQPGHVQFEDESAREKRKQPVGEGLRGQVEGAVHGEGEGTRRRADERCEILLQAQPGAVHGGTDDLEKAGGGAQLGRDGQGRKGCQGRRARKIYVACFHRVARYLEKGESFRAAETQPGTSRTPRTAGTRNGDPPCP